MDTAIISLICIALVVFGGMTMAQGFITSVDASTTGLEEVGQRDETIMRTEITPVDATYQQQFGPDPLEITVENTGQTKLADFEDWDVIVQYYDGWGNYHVEWLPYASSPGTNEWGIVWIRLDGGSEIYEPNVLNPGEQVLIRTYLNPGVGNGTTNMVVISTPSGVTASTYFSP